MALSLVMEPLAAVVNPVMRNRGDRTKITSSRSQFRPFELSLCLPKRMRIANLVESERRLIMRLANEITDRRLIRSFSRENIQKILLLFDHLIFGDGFLPPLVDASSSIDEQWDALRDIRSTQWVDRLARLWEAHRECRTKDSTGKPVTVSFDLLNRDVRFLRLLQGPILHPGTKSTIPLMSCLDSVDHDRTDDTSGWYLTGNHTSASSSNESAGSGDATAFTEKEILHQLRGIAIRNCGVEADTEARVYSLTPEEARRVVECALTAEERLMVCIFLTQGLRRSGLTHLRAAGIPAALQDPTDVPTKWVTTEKNNKTREIIINRACKILVAQWFREGRPASETTFLFPSPRDPTREISSGHVWKICKRLFARAKVDPRHAHPHAFRHTVVKMLLYTGWDISKVSKYIGHASPAITEQRYNRLTEVEVSEIAASMDIEQASWADEQKRKWLAFRDYLKRPYSFPGVEWEGMDAPSRVHVGNDKRQRQSELVTRSKDYHRDAKEPRLV